MSTEHVFLGNDHLPKKASLIIPGRLNHEQAVALERCFEGRKLIWLCEEKTELDPITESHIATSDADAIAFSERDPDLEKVGRNILEDLGADGVAIFLPGIVNAVNGAVSHIRAETLRALCKLKIDVVPVAVGVSEENKLATAATVKRTSVVFEPTLKASEVNPARWHQSVMLGNFKAYQELPFLKESLGYHLLKGLKLNSKNYVFDGTSDQKRSFGFILGASLALAKQLKELTKKERVAIILPPGTGGLIANIAVIFAGKVPVNLNFTAGDKSIKSAIAQANVDKFITADPFVRKMSDFPWPPLRDLIHVERVLPKLKKRIRNWIIASKLLPANMLMKLAKIDQYGGDKEAVLLFTSGSSGDPKGVPLTHTNVLANVCQFSGRLDQPSNISILGCLPLFHSFGCTATLWFPIIEGLNLITFPNPTDVKRLAALIQSQKVTMLLSTPTFLRGYMRRVEPEQLASIQLIVTGAEKLPTSLAKAFEEKFGILPQEGYGLTETSPATNFNIIRPKTSTPEPDISSSRIGSVGQFLPGIALKMINPATEKKVDIDQSGLILLKGPNVFSGYLENEEKTNAVFDEGWFKTGDIGRLDHDGFLHIEGRISRFSKIAGEMVPHETLEAAIITALNLDSESERKIAVVGVPDEKKGEAIMLLSSVTSPESAHEVVIELRYKLLDAGIPSLWCPKEIHAVDYIPILASGKLDIKGCEELAKEITG